MTRFWIAVLLMALIAAGCGGNSPHKTTTSATTTTKNASTTSAPASDCNTLGINPTKMREGTCTHAGITYVIVDENHTLKLGSLWAKLDRIRKAGSLANGANTAKARGQFVIASLTITNKLPAPQTFDQGHTQQAAVILNGALVPEDVSVEKATDPSSCLAASPGAIKPNQSKTCEVVFDVPLAAVAVLGMHGSGDLYLVDFGSDLSGSITPKTVGQIRLYR